MNLNKVIIAGRMTKDPEQRSLENGNAVASFGVATNRYFTDSSGEKQERVEFHNVVLFGKTAEIAGKYLKKGSLVLIEGRLQTRSWEGKDGVKRYSTEIVGDTLQFGPKGSETQEVAGERKEEGKKEEKEDNIPVIDEDDEIDVEDIPF